MQGTRDAARRHGRPMVTAAASLIAIVAAATSANAQSTPLTTVRVASALARPVYVTAPAGDLDRLFIVEQRSGTTGRIRILDLRTNTLAPTPFLSVPNVSTNDEQGLLGLAFHPDYLENGYFWVYYTASNWSTVIRRYRASGDPATATTADPNSAALVMTFSQPFENHNGGWMSFGPDGHLYIASGDGGAGGDPGARAQNRFTLLGKILRIDVDGPDNIPGNADDDQFPGDDTKLYSIPANNPFANAPTTGNEEIWAVGVRNPWRCDFDPVTGDFYIADVGQDAWEEINFQPANGNAAPGQPGYQGGRNYGWRCYEGNGPFNLAGCAAPSSMTFPFLVYGHTQQVAPTFATGCSISGGIVYRGCAIPDLQGTYFFADLCTNRAFSLRYDGTTVTNFQERTAELRPAGQPQYSVPASFGRDARGEMYICSLSGGAVFKVVPTTIVDLNGDGISDNCVCPADWTGDGVTNSGDISEFLTTWLAAVNDGTAAADYDHSGQTNSGDISAFLTSWLAAVTGDGC